MLSRRRGGPRNCGRGLGGLGGVEGYVGGVGGLALHGRSCAGWEAENEHRGNRGIRGHRGGREGRRRATDDAEGDGYEPYLTFTVSLSNPSYQTIKVLGSVEDGTATADVTDWWSLNAVAALFLVLT